MDKEAVLHKRVPLDHHEMLRAQFRAAIMASLQSPPTLPAPGGPDPPGQPITAAHGAAALVPKIIG